MAAPSELGIKQRGGRSGVEIKGRILIDIGQVSTEPFVGPLQLWGKWTTDALALDTRPILATQKRRLFRKYRVEADGVEELPLSADENLVSGLALPPVGCNVEFTEVRVDGGAQWWTFAFEAFGPMETLWRSVDSVAKLLSDGGAQLPPDGIQGSYPELIFLEGYNPQRGDLDVV